MSAQALIAQKKAEIAAKIAAMTKGSAAATPTPPPKPTPSPALATPPPASGAGTPTDDIARRVAEAKRRVAEAQSKLAIKDNPYMVRSTSQPRLKMRPNNRVVGAAARQEGHARRRASSAGCWSEDGGSPASSRHIDSGPSVEERPLQTYAT